MGRGGSPSIRWRCFLRRWPFDRESVDLRDERPPRAAGRTTIMADTRLKPTKTFSRKIDPLLKTNNDTGFGTSAANYGGRFINRDGTFNVRREGVPFLNRFSIYHSMLSMPRWKFIGLLVLSYFVINLVYSLIYLWVG